MKVVKLCTTIHYLKDEDGYKDCYIRCIGRVTEKKARELVKAVDVNAVFAGVSYTKEEITIPDEIVNEYGIFCSRTTKTEE